MNAGSKFPPHPGDRPSARRGGPPYRGRFHGNQPRPPVNVAAKVEDAQPNELLKKRNVAGPPVIRASVPFPRVRGRGRGRGGPSYGGGQRGGSPFPRTIRADTNANERSHGVPQNAQFAEQPPSGSTVRLHEAFERSSASHEARTPRLGEPLPGWTPLVSEEDNQTPCTERPPWAIQSGAPIETAAVGTGARPYIHPNTSGPPASTLRANIETERHRAYDPSSRSRNTPSVSKGHQHLQVGRDTPPHLGRPSDSFAHGDPQPQAGPSRATRALSGAANVSLHTGVQGPSNKHYGLNELPLSTSQHAGTLASASDLLLSDLHLPTVSALAHTHTRGDQPPPSKRRKLSPRPISPPRPSLQARSPIAHPDTVDTPSSFSVEATHHRLSPFLEPAGMSLPSNLVKRERSPTPTLSESDTQAPRLVSEGCVRVAPMPPECKSGLPGYQVARKGWTAREVKKLRERGLMPTRVLIREDGMVIDWKSKVPVLSDTLQPPPSGAGAAVTDPPVVSEQERIERGPSRSNSISTQVAVADNPDEPAAPLLVAALGKPRIPRVKPRPIPPSGQTVWESVSLPPRRPPAPSLAAPPEPSRSSGTDGSRTLRRKSAPVPELPTNASGKPAAVSKPPDTHSDSTRSSVPADVEIIDLTCDPDDDADPHRSSSSSPEPLAQLTARRRPRLLPTPDDTPPVHLSSPAGSPEIQEQAPSALRSSAPVQPRPNRYRRLDTAVVDIDLTEEADIDETQAEAIRFLERYLKTFMLDRSDLASAYSHTATFSVQILPPSPQTGLRPVGTTYPPSCHHQGRLAVIAALLDLPEDKFAEPDAGGVPQRKFDWDFCHAREAGDVLLICSSVTAMPLWESDVDAGAGAKGKGKGKERAAEDDSGPSRARLGVCEQRFVLRSRDWDEEDRSTPGVWPLVAVAHHMLYRPLPPR